MENSFDKKVAFITGAGQGIGLQIAKQLVQEGAVVYLNDRDESLAQRAAENLQADGGHCIPLPGDVRSGTNYLLYPANKKRTGKARYRYC